MKGLNPCASLEVGIHVSEIDIFNLKFINKISGI
jgi:hypothetical protein